jgi:hypothetical protein
MQSYTRLAFKKASSDSLRNFFPGVGSNIKMTFLLAEETSASIKIKVTYKVMEASSLSLTKRNMSIYEDACKQNEVPMSMHIY